MPDDQIEHCLTFAFARYVAPSAGGCKPQVGIAQLSAQHRPSVPSGRSAAASMLLMARPSLIVAIGHWSRDNGVRSARPAAIHPSNNCCERNVFHDRTFHTIPDK